MNRSRKSHRLRGPYNFIPDEINKRITRKSPGVYALLSSKKEVLYVGRSDDLRQRLLDRLKESSYKYFKYGYALSSKDAFEWECNLWHYHKPPHNINHPQKPSNKKWKCPRCGK